MGHRPAGHAARDHPRLDALGNLLGRDFADVGIGVAAGAPIALDAGELGGTYVTDFGRRLRD